jgi:hypothetical protein
MIKVKAGIKEAAEAPKIRRRQLDAPLTKAISSDESDGRSHILSTSYIIYVIDEQQYDGHRPIEVNNDTVSCFSRPHCHCDFE